MKILILTNNYPTKNALNNGIFIHQQVKALQQLGAQVHVLLLHNWYPPFGLHRLHTYWKQGYEMHANFFETYEGVKIYSVPMFVRMPGRWFKETYYDRAARAIIKYVIKHSTLLHADWLYAHFLTDNAYIAAKVKDRLHVKLAAIARGDDIHAWPEQNPSLKQHLHLVFHKADLLLANSKNLAKDTAKWMQQGNKRAVETVYNGIDHVQFRPAETEGERNAIKEKYGLAADKKYLVCIATPVALKGWIELLHAIRELGDRFNGWQLLMIAPPRDNKDAINLPQMGVELGIADKLKLIPGLPANELAEILRGCDAFVLASYNEGMANALLEAMASGLPCIATEVGGHNEVIENGESGILIKPRSADEIANAILSILNDDELRTTMGIKARERMIQFGDYVQNAGKLMELLKKF